MPQDYPTTALYATIYYRNRLSLLRVIMSNTFALSDVKDYALLHVRHG